MAEPVVPSTDEPDDVAGEYVLGVLDAERRAAAASQAAADPAFAAAVAAWEARLIPLIDEVGPVPPPPAVWRRIAMQLGLAAGARPPRMTERVGFWRAVAGASLVAAAASIVALVVVPRPGPLVTPPPVQTPAPAPAAPQPLAMARLQAESGVALFIATLDPATHRLAVAPATVSASPVHSHELWLIPASGPPRSLGLIDAERALTLTVPADLASGATLAVSAEPVGGSTTGLPTGPVVATGKLNS